MMEGLVTYWRGLSLREQVLVGVMSVLLAIVVLWLGIARPVEGALAGAIEQHGAALDRNAAVRTKTIALKALPRGSAAGPTAPISLLIGQSVGEAGFTLERNQEQGPGRVDIAIASVRPQALFSWISGLEAQGIMVETLSAQPSGTTGTVSVQAILKSRTP